MSDALLVLRLSALGDILHTLPSVQALRNAFPARRIGWVVERPYVELVRLIAPVDQVMSVATKRWRKNLSHRDTWRELGAARRDIRHFAAGGTAIDFQGLNKSAILAMLSGAKERVGFDAEAIREKSAGWWLNRRVAIDRSLHVVEQNLQLASSLGASPELPSLPHLQRLPEDPDHSLQPLIEQHPLVLNPGAGHPSKLWPIDRFAQLAAALYEKHGSRPLVVWGPSERTMAEEIAREGHAVLAPETNLRQLAFLLSRARLVIASDTGPLHLAAALATPVIGLFGPTDPRRNGPHGQIQRCVETFSSHRSMEQIQVDDVLSKTGEILA